MKTLIILIGAILFCFQTFAADENYVLKMEEVSERIAKNNLTQVENAIRVYQAKENIHFSKRNLLPKLNLWRLAGVVVEGVMGNYAGAAMGLIEDIAPFLVPANWFRVKQSKILYQAQLEQYKSIWSNVLMTAKLLFINTLRDQATLATLESQVQQLDDLIELARSREIFGGTTPQFRKSLEIRRFELLEDVRAFKLVLYESKKNLLMIAGIEINKELMLEAIPLPNLEELKPIDASAYLNTVLSASPELKQYDHLVLALKSVKKEVSFSILGVSSASRGIMGGIFDNIPMQDGLGFGAGPSIRIAKGEAQALLTQKQASSETLKKGLYVLAEHFNSTLGYYPDILERFQLAQENYDLIKSNLILGGEVDFVELKDALVTLLSSELMVKSYLYDALLGQEKLSRMTFSDDYNKMPAPAWQVEK